MYASEENLVKDFISKLDDSPFAGRGIIKYATEFNFNRGRTDLIMITPDYEIIAIEAKLEKWRDALQQAYINTCYAHYSYILLPQETAERASQYEAEFLRRSVGICYMTEDGIEIAQPANKNSPFQDWLSDRAIDKILGGGGGNGQPC